MSKTVSRLREGAGHVFVVVLPASVTEFEVPDSAIGWGLASVDADCLTVPEVLVAAGRDLGMLLGARAEARAAEKVRT